MTVFATFLDRVVDRVLRVADVADRARAQALGPGVVFLLLDVTGRLVEQLLRLAQTIAVRELGIDRRVVGERLAVVDRRLA